MANLFIEKTKRTPEVTFLRSGDFYFSGTCIPEDAGNFFHPLMLWLEEFCQKPSGAINLHLDLEYINTSSIVHIIKFIKKTLDAEIEKSSIKIIWKYDHEDEDSFEQGEILQKVIKHPILLISNQVKG